jgi:hypothetical protein
LVHAEVFIRNPLSLSTSQLDGIVLLSVCLQTGITTTRWIIGELAVFSLKCCLYSLYFLAIMNLTKCIKSTIYWELHLKNCLINSKSKKYTIFISIVDMLLTWSLISQRKKAQGLQSLLRTLQLMLKTLSRRCLLITVIIECLLDKHWNITISKKLENKIRRLEKVVDHRTK